jgi:hypothetical protein
MDTTGQNSGNSNRSGRYVRQPAGYGAFVAFPPNEATFVPPPPHAVAQHLSKLEHLYQQPVVSVNAVQALIETTYPAASDLVVRLVERGTRTEITGQQRHRRDIDETDIDLFTIHRRSGNDD